MESSRTFTNADEHQLSDLIRQARQRLVFAAPGITDSVAEALAGRITAIGAPSQLAVILDVDPEVCRLGYGTLSGLEKVTQALESQGLRLQTALGLRVGLLISDDQTLIYSPTPFLIEAGSTAPTKPNALLLKPDALSTLAVACGLGEGHKASLQQEIGLDCLNQAQLETVKKNLEENPPKKFDLARIERVFNYELQFVEFKVEGYQLGRRIVPLEPTWLGLSDRELKDRFRNSFRLFESGEAIEVEVLEQNKDGKQKNGKPRKVTEKTINDEAQCLRKELIPLGPYGSVILKRKKPNFEKKVETFRQLMAVYAEKVRSRIEMELSTVRERLINDLAPGLAKNPPKEWRDRSFTGGVDEPRVRQLLTDGLDQVFASVRKDFNPQVILVFKDVTYPTIVDDPQFRKRLEDYFGPEEVRRLFDEHEAAREILEGS